MKTSDINAKTGIPIKELNHLNRDFWYHGTSLEGAESIKKLGVLADFNHGNSLDFGAGFYLTETKKLADSYMSRVPVIGADGKLTKRTEWAVIEFKFNPYTLLFGSPSETSKDELTVFNGLSYTYKNFAKHNEEFAKFVFDNRRNSLESPNSRNVHCIDIIWGVMSDSIPDQVMIDFSNNELTYEQAIEKLMKSNSMKQLYIGSQAICEMLEFSNIFIFRGSQEA